MPEDSRNPFLEAFRAGLSPIPVDTTTKKPLVAWKCYQERAADFDELTEWSGRNIGVICGQVSGRLIAIDIESAFMARLGELAQRLDAAGLLAVFKSWVAGYSETTARGGMHVLVRVAGDGAVERNRKLAMAANGETVWIETRAEGGYVVVSPSRNGERGWDMIDGGFDTIAQATAQEWAAVAAILASFDETPPTMPPSVVVTPSILRLGDSWIDAELEALPSVAEILSAHGWVQDRSSDDYGDHWVRPDKDPRTGYSASVNHHSGRLWVHSTSAGLPIGVSMDAVDLTFALDHHRMPSLTERTEVLRAHRRVAGPGGAATAAAEGEESADTTVRLDGAFWQGAPWLATVRAAAWARGLSPAGVLGALLSAYATTIPTGIWLPPVWGERAPLNTYCCLVGQSGSGKTASMRLASDLLGPVHNPDILLGRSLRSGEGLVNLATKSRPKSKDGFGEEPSFRNAVQITFDEGAALGKQAERSGATVIPYLNTAWAGHGTVGGAKAGEQGYFPADLVRICAVIGVQLGAAANLFTGESAALGFPQRLLFFGLRDPEMMAMDVDTMSMDPVRPIGLPEYPVHEFTRSPLYLEVPAEIAHEVRSWTQNKEHGTGLADPLDGHAMQLRLRVAALLALADARCSLCEHDWELGKIIALSSQAIRAQLLISIGDVHRQRARAQGEADVIRDEIRDDAWLNKRARRIQGYLRTLKDGATMKEVKSRLNAQERPRREEIVAYAEAKGWVIHRDGRVFHRGD